MEYYEGLDVGVDIKGGGRFVKERGYGGEIYNFKHDGGFVYGYVEPGGHSVRDNPSAPGNRLKIERIAGSTTGDSISDVLAVWVAMRPGVSEMVVVGWYDNATVYRTLQMPASGANRMYNGKHLPFNVMAAFSDAVRLSPDERQLSVPYGSKSRGGIGQSSIWYADNSECKLHREARREVLNYIASLRSPKQRKLESGRQPDPYLRAQVERAAIEETATHYSSNGYEVESVEEDNLGWDLEAVRGDIKLRLEVKGLSGAVICVDVTPREYAKMREYRDSYRLCVVTNALTGPKLSVFAFSNDLQRWADQDGQTLEIEEIVAARCRVGRR